MDGERPSSSQGARRQCRVTPLPGIMQSKANKEKALEVVDLTQMRTVREFREKGIALNNEKPSILLSSIPLKVVHSFRVPIFIQ